MTTIIDEAEERYLAALLERTLPDGIAALTSEEFSQPRHGECFELISHYRTQHPTWGADQMVEAIGGDERVEAATQALIHHLADRGGLDDDHIAIYTDLIQASAFARSIQHTTPAGEATDHDQRVATALANTVDDYHTRLTAPFDHHPDTPTPEETGVDWHTRAEEQLIAALMRDPSIAPQVTTLVDPADMTDPRRKALYEDVASCGWNNEPIDDLRLHWNLGEVAKHTSHTDTETDSGLINRLYATDVDSPTAMAAAHRLNDTIIAEQAPTHHHHHEPTPGPIVMPTDAGDQRPGVQPGKGGDQ
ncbi:DnaB-like helicase N-terminal domain-containing protein [Haloglycomyces albus]|uniref:DnaB-like helicase N-terminal domain-containing protein n=1 Tax=Haloglycomyces albus TaxID=526067 RepID=UPI00046D0D7D|nr:DnaB-like helicase N-terminal domain-containing protein [Haloglycomyces albus]